MRFFPWLYTLLGIVLGPLLLMMSVDFLIGAVTADMSIAQYLFLVLTAVLMMRWVMRSAQRHRFLGRPWLLIAGIINLVIAVGAWPMTSPAQLFLVVVAGIWSFGLTWLFVKRRP